MTEPRYGGQTEAWWWVQSDINTVLIDSTDQWTDIIRPLNGVMIDGEGRMYACKFPIYCSIARVYMKIITRQQLQVPFFADHRPRSTACYLIILKKYDKYFSKYWLQYLCFLVFVFLCMHYTMYVFHWNIFRRPVSHIFPVWFMFTVEVNKRTCSLK